MAGWTVEQLIEHVSKRTENRADDKIDLEMEFFLALDEFCSEQFFWWRKKRATFTTVIGTNTYDLSKVAPDFAQFDTAYLIKPDGITLDGEMTPITGPTGQLKASLNTTQDVPASYFIDTNTSPQELMLQAPASVAQKILFTYWAIPMVTDTTEEDIPLVPNFLHWGLIYALERRVYEMLYGQEDPRYTVANARYEAFCEKAYAMPGWTTREVVTSRASSSAVNTVQAHR